jgi:DNA-binding XRE family transcriptional regulator
MLAPALAAPITSAQIRAGRGLLKWTQGVLASRAAVSVVTLNMIESEQVQPRNRTIEAIRRVLEGEGIRFIGDAEAGYGVLLRPRCEAGSASGPASRSMEAVQ